MNKVEFDQMCVTYYANKMQSCKSRNIEFNLTFTQVKNMLRAKRCQYTGVTLTKSKGCSQNPTDVTIERINSELPYQSGNVLAVSYAANQAKSNFDRIYGKDSGDVIIKISKVINKRRKM